MGSKFVLGATFFLFLVALFIKAKAADIDIKKFGAKADGKTDDSQVQFSARFGSVCVSCHISSTFIIYVIRL